MIILLPSAAFNRINTLFIQNVPQKVDGIHPPICLACSCISSVQIQLEIQLFRLRISVKVSFNSLVNKQLGGLAMV